MSATIQHAAPIATAAKLFCGFGDPTRLAIITTLDQVRYITALPEWRPTMATLHAAFEQEGPP